ncbi:gonadotropin-releasing hormone receptor isoform X2 [Patella vulgata]|uniref:gonadotropin-releasing hormone receptor isoform X2 n=1 Tax=Patella vulgata TaxID=6465 RepID=UPI0021805023|nr:gonadotropin-releasing hormone receptor isoform X2 [Patella vulgata]
MERHSESLQEKLHHGDLQIHVADSIVYNTSMVHGDHNNSEMAVNISGVNLGGQTTPFDMYDEPPPQFDDISMTKSVVFGTMFVISFFGNTATLIQMYRMRHRKSTINTLIVNLAIADLLITFFCLSGEGIWAATVQWYGGVAMCKIVKYVQVFSLYLSTYITVAIGLDRCVAILDPMRRKSAPTRVRTMIILAWFFSALFSIPQAVIFNVRRGPFKQEFYQCVTMGSYAKMWQRQVYSISSLLLMFMIPLVIIGTAYGLIFSTISRKSKEFTVRDGYGCYHYRTKSSQDSVKKYMCITASDDKSTTTGERNGRTTSYNEIPRSNLLRKAKRKSLRMSIVIVLVFIICWTPYYVIFICLTFSDREEIHPEIYTFLMCFFFVGMSNAMLNPLIYGAFQICKVHTPRLWRRSGSPKSSINLPEHDFHGRDSNCSKDIPASSLQAHSSKKRLIGSCHCDLCVYGRSSLNRQHQNKTCVNGICHVTPRRRKHGDLRSCCLFNSY